MENGRGVIFESSTPDFVFSQFPDFLPTPPLLRCYAYNASNADSEQERSDGYIDTLKRKNPLKVKVSKNKG